MLIQIIKRFLVCLFILQKLGIFKLHIKIKGIGHVSTRWVGTKGKEELITEAMAIKYQAELEELKSRTINLASECKKALTLLNHPETSKAINLCNEFLLPATRHTQEDKTNESLCMLWKGQLYALHSTKYSY